MAIFVAQNGSCVSGPDAARDACSIKLALFGTIISLRGLIYTSNNQFVQKNLGRLWIPRKLGQKNTFKSFQLQ